MVDKSNQTDTHGIPLPENHDDAGVCQFSPFRFSNKPKGLGDKCWTQLWSICQTGRSQFRPCDAKRPSTSKKRPIREVEDRGTVAETSDSIHYKRKSRHMKKNTLKNLERATPTLRPCFHSSSDPFS
ncbi:hypothetical protein F2Q69_00036975 [Brassica cretica]|uniref:Uncharacterized protein n=1 Tax=Brassica cretica TaxID=69181 RepID=A0A8S9SCD4_BRACR|nr:hypothetical protein F2Q69_00036975 [Brassica cretica]